MKDVSETASELRVASTYPGFYHAVASNIVVLKEEITTLTSQRDKLRQALEKIDGFSMSQFAKIEDMLAACKLVASDALSQTKEGV